MNGNAYRYRVNEPVIAPNALQMVKQVLESGYLSPGAFTRAFEDAWANEVGTKYAVACNSGTAALHLAFMALKLNPGDEVIVPALTCPDTINAVVMAGGTPVIVDVESERLGLDPDAVERAITPRTVGIVPVHLYGVPVAPRVFEVAGKHKLWVVEDCAEAHGAHYNGQVAFEWANVPPPPVEVMFDEHHNVGSVGTLGCFSFRGDKIIGIGTGGMVTTNDEALAARARYLIGLASGGGYERYYSTEMGFSYEMDNVRAALGLAQISTLADTLRGKMRVANWYRQELSSDVVDHPQHVNGAAWWKYAPRLKNLTAQQAYLALDRIGIETSPPFVPLYRLPMYRETYVGERVRYRTFEDRFPVAEDAYRRLLCLPSSARLQFADVQAIADAVEQVCG